MDVHVHAGPSIYPRSVSDFELASTAKTAGMRDFVLRAHEKSTVSRAKIVSERVQGVEVYASVTLNDFVGGLNIMPAGPLHRRYPRGGLSGWWLLGCLPGFFFHPLSLDIAFYRLFGCSADTPDVIGAVPKVRFPVKLCEMIGKLIAHARVKNLRRGDP